MADQPIRMLRYWTDEKGLATGLKEYYPDLVAKDPVIRLGLEALYVAEMNLRNQIEQLMWNDEEEPDV